MKKAMLFPLIFAALISCSDNSSSQRTNGYSQVPHTRTDSLLQEVMDGHDAAMARMGRLEGNRKLALRQADSLAAAGSTDGARSLRRLADQLRTVGDRMNNWMENFNMDSAKDDVKKRIVYLQAEKAKVNAVKTEVLVAVAAADSILRPR